MKTAVNKTKLTLLTTFSILAATTTASALASDGGGSSGGGNSVVCFDDPSIPPLVRQNGFEIFDSAIPHIVSIEALDLYEAKLPRGLEQKTLEIIPTLAGETELGYVLKIENRFSTIIPEITNIVGTWRNYFNDENVILVQHGLKRVDDAREVTAMDSEHCVLATMATQYSLHDRPILNLDKRLFYHPNHSILSRAVLLLHEYLYARARQMGQTDSLYTRALVRMLIMQNNDQTLFALHDSLVKLGFVQTSDVQTYWEQLVERIHQQIIQETANEIQNVEKQFKKEIAAAVNYADEALAGLENELVHIERGNRCTTLTSCRLLLELVLNPKNARRLYYDVTKHPDFGAEWRFIRGRISPQQRKQAKIAADNIEAWLKFEATVVMRSLKSQQDKDKVMIENLNGPSSEQKAEFLKYYGSKLSELTSILEGFDDPLLPWNTQHEQKKYSVAKKLHNFEFSIDYLVPAITSNGGAK